MDTFNDKNLTCADCGQEFVFSKNEQAFYAERGFTNEPNAARTAATNAKCPAMATAEVASARWSASPATVAAWRPKCRLRRSVASRSIAAIATTSGARRRAPAAGHKQRLT